MRKVDTWTFQEFVIDAGFSLKNFFVVDKSNTPVTLHLIIKREPPPSALILPRLEIPFSSFPRAFLSVGRYIMNVHTSFYCLSGMKRAVSGWPEGFGAGILGF